MAENEREFWLAGGEDKVKVEAFIREREEARNKMVEVAKRYGGDAIGNGHSIVGLAFPDDTAPTSWTRKGSADVGGKSRPYFLPKKNSAANREARAEITAVRMKGARDFHAMLFPGSGGVMAGASGRGWGFRILYSTWEFAGDNLLLAIPLEEGKSNFKPNGSRLLKMSEYWALVEAAKGEAA